jgi:hypothetical protein
MILAKSTPHGAGITLYGDYKDLQNLHETIHKICKEGGPLTGQMNEFVLGLAYDIRHAYQGDRDTFVVDGGAEKKSEYYGESILWPIFLVQVSLLRWAAAFMPTTKEMQSNLYRLEACTEEALLSYDRSIGTMCIELMNCYAGLTHNYLVEFITERTEIYIGYSSVGKKRFKQLPAILRSIAPSSPEYLKFEMQLQKIAKEKGCKPEELTTIADEWPKFKW